MPRDDGQKPTNQTHNLLLFFVGWLRISLFSLGLCPVLFSGQSVVHSINQCSRRPYLILPSYTHSPLPFPSPPTLVYFFYPQPIHYFPLEQLQLPVPVAKLGLVALKQVHQLLNVQGVVLSGWGWGGWGGGVNEWVEKWNEHAYCKEVNGSVSTRHPST